MRWLALLALVLGIAAALWVWLAPPEKTVPATGVQIGAVLNLADKDPQIINAGQGDILVLTVIARTEDTLHLSGYDIGQNVGPGLPKPWRFFARHAGRFELKSQRTGKILAIVKIERAPKP